MADTTTTNLGLVKPGVADPGGINAWGGKINADLDAIDGIFRGDGLGTGVGMQIGTGKTLVIAGALGMITGGLISLVNGAFKVATTVFSIFDKTDSTKIVQFDASGITTGTTRTLKAPNASGTVALGADPLGHAIIPGFINGCQLSATTNTTLTLTSGTTCDSTKAYMLVMSGGTINLASTGANGLDTGSLAANATYHVFAIGKTDGTTAWLASTSLASPTLPSGYTLFRRVLSVTSDGSSHIIAVIQHGDRMTITTPSTANGSWSSGNPAAIPQCPTGIVVEACMSGFGAGNAGIGGWGFDIYELAQTRNANQFITSGVSGASSAQAGFDVRVVTNTSAQVGYFNVSTSSISVIFTGWIDRRGQDA